MNLYKPHLSELVDYTKQIIEICKNYNIDEILTREMLCRLVWTNMAAKTAISSAGCLDDVLQRTTQMTEKRKKAKSSRKRTKSRTRNEPNNNNSNSNNSNNR
ncbi:hypothetical protein PAEPH01_2498 [Pancytospora epiphaga]|nr:hypothetical protein PAEPH01_2498 [Pancytospora epiphaga]